MLAPGFCVRPRKQVPLAVGTIERITLVYIASLLDTGNWLLLAEKPSWFYVTRRDVGSDIYLAVYRSCLLDDDTDPWWSAVSELILGAAVVEVLVAEVVEDESMMFGSAEYSLIRLGVGA